MTVPKPVRSPELIGRDDELAACRAAVSAAGDGRGAFLMIAGEAGIGKSRLADEVVGQALATGDVVVLRGWATPGDAPYRSLAQALLGAGIDARDVADPAFELFRGGLSRLLPGLPVRAASDGADPTLAVAEGLFLLLARRAGWGAALLVIEDSHLADAETLLALQYLRHAVSRGPVVVLATARSDESWDRDMRALARGPLVTRIDLDRWTPDRIAEFAGSAGRPLSAGAAGVLAGVSGGVPLLVEELLPVIAEQFETPRPAERAAELPGGPPSGFTALTGDRLERLGADHRRLIRAAAVLGDPGDYDLIAAVTEREVADVLDALRAATAVGLMAWSSDRVGDRHSGSGSWGWRHSLTRDAVLDSAIPPERAAFAARAAEAMQARLVEQEGSLTSSRAGLIELWALAGRTDLAARECVELSREAVREGSLASAERWLARGAALSPQLEFLTAERVAVLTQTGRGAEALELGAPELDRLRGRERSATCLELARAAIVDEQWSRALDLVESSGLAGEPRGDILAADAYFGAGEVDRATLLAERALDALEQRPASAPRDRELAAARCEAWDVLGRSRLALDPTAGEDAFRQAVRVAADAGLTTWRVRALVGVGIAELSRLEISPALAMARDLAASTGQLAVVASVDLLLSDSTMVVDGPDVARDSGLACADLAGRLGLDRLSAMGSLLVAQTYALSGDTAGMSGTLARALDRSPDAPGIAALSHCVRGLHRLVTGDLEGARDRLDRGIEVLARSPSEAPYSFWGLWVLVRTSLADRDEEARALLRRAPARSRAINAAALTYAEAIAAGRDGRSSDAERLFAQAEQLLPTQRWWRRLLRLLPLESAVVDGWGRPVEELRSDLAVYDNRGEPLLARSARDLLRRAGVGVRRGRGDAAVPPALGAIGVTSREMDVLMLVAQGMTNAQVAARLFLSTRTVDHHVANLLAKTGAGGRVELRSLVGG